MKLEDFIELSNKVKAAAGRGDREITLPVGPILTLVNDHAKSLERDIERGRDK